MYIVSMEEFSVLISIFREGPLVVLKLSCLKDCRKESSLVWSVQWEMRFLDSPTAHNGKIEPKWRKINDPRIYGGWSLETQRWSVDAFEILWQLFVNTLLTSVTSYCPAVELGPHCLGFKKGQVWDRFRQVGDPGKLFFFIAEGVCWSCWILPLLTTFVVMSMSQDTFPRDVQTSVHNKVLMVPVVLKCWLTHMKRIWSLRLVLQLTLHHHFWTIWCLRHKFLSSCLPWGLELGEEASE